MTEVRVRAVAPSPTAVVAGRLDRSRVMPSFDAVYAFLRGGQTQVRQTGQNVARYRGGEHMEVGVEVDSRFEPAGGVVPSELPGGRVAEAVHTTGYGDLHRTYDAIAAWCAANGQSPTGDVWEIYADPDEDDHVDVLIRYLLA